MAKDHDFLGTYNFFGLGETDRKLTDGEAEIPERQ